jgi:Protein of unknown function (DUF3684)
MLVVDPQRFYSLAGNPESYLTLLRAIAANAAALSNTVKRQMQKSAFLLGGRRVVSSDKRESNNQRDSNRLWGDEDEESDSFLQYQLATASELVIVVRRLSAQARCLLVLGGDKKD